MEKVLPQLVHTGDNGMKSVEYANVTALLIEGIKAQEKKIEELEKRIEQLEKKK